MMPAAMARPVKLLALAIAAAGASVSLAACGSQGVEVAKSDPTYRGAVLFSQHCSGCHTLSVAGATGSATNVRSSEHTDGPNFNVRKEQVGNVLFAIRNGGYSGAIMPQNIVTGKDAQAIAEFLAKYSGRQAKSPPSPQG
jgi:mono/diheme cytochrome c family protein